VTGRFLSRDPNDPQSYDSEGDPTDPRVLHKYLYAGGDPVNGLDPTGKGEIFDYFFAQKGGILNSNAFVRLGLGWNNEIGCMMFRLAVGAARYLIHFHIDIAEFWCD
jgi:hypothetical protein